MDSPTEQKTVQARILAYAQEIGQWLVSRDITEARRLRMADWSVPDSCFCDDLLDAKVCEFNLRYAEAEVVVLGKFSRLVGGLRLRLQDGLLNRYDLHP